MTYSSPKILVLVSGKGGSGKTTVAIAIAKLLADMGHGCLLIDFDLSTNGGSYFFKNRFDHIQRGIWEVLAEQESIATSELQDLPITIAKNLYFVASRTRLNTKGTSYDAFNYKLEYLKSHILEPLVQWAKEQALPYVLIDCQAG